MKKTRQRQGFFSKLSDVVPYLKGIRFKEFEDFTWCEESIELYACGEYVCTICPCSNGNGWVLFEIKQGGEITTDFGKRFNTNGKTRGVRVFTYPKQCVNAAIELKREKEKESMKNYRDLNQVTMSDVLSALQAIQEIREYLQSPCTLAHNTKISSAYRDGVLQVREIIEDILTDKNIEL